MSVSRLARVFGTVALAAMWFSGQGQAHAPRGIATDLPKEHIRRIAEHMKALESLDDSDTARGMHSTMTVWTPTYPKAALEKIVANAGEQGRKGVMIDFVKASSNARERPEIPKTASNLFHFVY